MTTMRTIQRADAPTATRLQHWLESATARTTARINRCWRGEEGSTVAEMALVLPILLAVLTGVFSFGVALNQYLVLTNAVNNAARAFAMSAQTDGSVSMLGSGDPCQYAAQAVQSGASNMDTSNLTYTITYTTYLGNTSNTPTTTTYTGTGSTLPSCSSKKMYQYDVVTVKAVYPISPAVYGWATRSLSLTAQSVEMVQ
jgi:Flp pilus assembly protein TadG